MEDLAGVIADQVQAAIDALKLELTAEDITRIETAPDADKVRGKGMRNFVFTDGIMPQARKEVHFYQNCAAITKE